MPPARRLLPSLAAMLGMGLLFGVVIAAILTFTRSDASLRFFVMNAVVSATYSTVLGILGMLAMRALPDRVRRLPAFAQFLLTLLVLLGTTVAGALAASLLFVAAGVFPRDALWPNYLAGLRVALLITVMAAIGAYGYGRLRRRLDEAERLAVEARVASLESRIRPHFLFNALNTVAALIPEDPARAERTLERVTALLRSSLDSSGRLVPLRDELRVVADYLEIERARHGDRLRFTLEVAPEAEEAAVPAFAVQTLVENAVNHAVATRREGAEVRVSATRAPGGGVAIEVADDGPGFDGAVLPPGRGLESLRARLAALFGDAGRLDIDAARPGARVTVRVP